MSDVVADVAAVAVFLAADTTDVLAADTTDVLSAANAASGGSCPAITQNGIGLFGTHMAPNEISTSSLSSKFRGEAKYGLPGPYGKSKKIENIGPGPGPALGP